MRIVLPLTLLVLALVGYLAYRVLELEQRVTSLTKQLGAPAAKAGAAHAASPTPAGNHEQRIAALERGLTGMREDFRSLEEATGAVAEVFDPIGGEQRILSIVERKANKVRDRHIEFHRARWLEWREAALDNFAESFGLSPVQTERLHDLLAQEIDNMVGIIKRPETLENPEQAVSDWKAMLEETDRAAHRLLAPAQIPAWDQARFFERRALWPWLPENPPQQ